MAGHPNSLANLKPPWQPGVQPKPGPRYIERMLTIGNRAAPQAMRLISQVMNDPETHISIRIRCAEYIVDKHWPKDHDPIAERLESGGERQFTVTFVLPDGRKVDELDARKQSNGHFSVSFEGKSEE